MLKLVPPAEEYRSQICEMMDEWTAAGEKIVPFSICKLDYRQFTEYLNGFSEEKKGSPSFVPASTFFCLDTERNIFVGAVNIRHELNERLLLNGGHIGDGVRPSERKKGYATQMIALALEECRALGIAQVLMVCNQNNIASAKSIEKNGGVLENVLEVDGEFEKRYWIDVL